ncbi:DUF485 domain-containing protein [Cyclobacterium marinum]|uniref:Uncharacterized protein n=1 Tax=Cyclobacterium marinum (strain ATCC 25205 / DSM 745 / LMG 13164 / NCIMB 1802) TaxID=880070 RepID=G0J260_CYCMS|nr:hypothetical protein [Cyclobacterium marinum]AEL24569.1 hypothetical protein Cycma_0795 [Cyclobacterium marinum DSM 745]MBI0399228.1 hypothetical protein [Cyclobacterium marinum]MBR9774933.1 DUF485 domain-containing protein [Cytophagales bacterium]|tara:strand:- start:81616 stop:81969 length:354 start_codon:yes stop_codon:yes gene_type:complete
MKKVNSIFQLLTALFFGIGLVYFLTYEKMWGGTPLTGEVVSWLLAGLVIYLITWGTSWGYVSSLNSRIKKIELEKKDLKALVFDLERGGKVNPVERKTEVSKDDTESSVIKPRENFK